MSRENWHFRHDKNYDQQPKGQGTARTKSALTTFLRYVIVFSVLLHSTHLIGSLLFLFDNC